MKVKLQNKEGILKEAKYGFSWTTLLFGFFPALFRGDWKWALIMVVAAIPTVGISWFVFPFVYNKIYIKNLLEKGYGPADEQSRNFLIGKGLIAGNAPNNITVSSNDNLQG
jgi:hypothetical protein